MLRTWSSYHYGIIKTDNLNFPYWRKNRIVLISDVNMYMRNIKYRIPHYRIATKRELIKMNITQDDKCSFCGEVATLESLIYKCIKADSFWLDIKTCIKN